MTLTIYGALGVHIALVGLSGLSVGYVRSKNAVNALMSVMAVYWLGLALFWAVGDAFAFGASLGGWIGVDGFFLTGVASDAMRWWFHGLLVVFGGMVSVSGISGRARFGAGLVVIAGIVGVLLPVVHHWVWSPDGWLAALGFRDFGGVAAIHLPAGCAALGCIAAVGSRTGRFTREGLPNALPAHNLPLSGLGVVLLSFGWMGLLFGRLAECPDSATVGIGDLALRTLLAHFSGAAVAMCVAWGRFGKPDAALTLNGSVAGIVAVSGGVNAVSPLYAVVIGGIGGALVVLGTGWLDRSQVDDVGGVVPTHALAGAWGALATGLAHPTGGWLSGAGVSLLGVQILGIVVVAVASTAWGWGSCVLLSRFGRLRVTRDEELDGLDHTEHANEAYPDFQRAEFK
jgi:Amt family ammonium transporter